MKFVITSEWKKLPYVEGTIANSSLEPYVISSGGEDCVGIQIGQRIKSYKGIAEVFVKLATNKVESIDVEVEGVRL